MLIRMEKILSLHKTSAHMLRVGIPTHGFHVATDATGRTNSAVSFSVGAP